MSLPGLSSLKGIAGPVRFPVSVLLALGALGVRHLPCLSRAEWPEFLPSPSWKHLLVPPSPLVTERGRFLDGGQDSAHQTSHPDPSLTRSPS